MNNWGARSSEVGLVHTAAKKIAASADHVIAREFFLPEDRGDLPKVPACLTCNGSKSRLESYACTALLAGSNHEEGDRYRRDFVSKRLGKNPSVRREMGLGNPAQLLNVNGIIRPMHMLKVDAKKLSELMGRISRGLYYYHYGEPLDPDFEPEVSMQHPDHEGALWAGLAELFPDGCARVGASLGRGSFIYEGARSPHNRALTVWRMAWHNGINLYGENAPPQGITHWWCVTRPTIQALTKAELLDPHS